MTTTTDKLATLAEHYGYADVMEMLEEATCDSIVPAICTEPGCTYSRDLEPDAENCPCENCGERSVTSCLILAGLI